MLNLIMILLLSVSQQAINENNFVLAEEILSHIIVFPAEYNNYYYQKLLVDYSLNKKENVLKDLLALQDSFEPLNRRQQAMTFLIGQEVVFWTNGLDDINREMTKSRNRLKNLDPNKDTQEIQKKIVDKLNKYIEELENPPPPGSPGDPNDPNPKKGPPKPSSDSDNPLDDSKIMGGKAKGINSDKEFRKFAEQWGSLPPKEREKVVTEITKEIPPKYREFWDLYVKSLNKVK